MGEVFKEPGVVGDKIEIRDFVYMGVT